MSTEEQSPALPPNAAALEVCARCGALFRCGMKMGVAECWCAQVPPVAPQAELQGCVCARCLAERQSVQPYRDCFRGAC